MDFVYGIIAFILVAILTPLVGLFAARFNFVAKPQGEKKEMHKTAIPLLGGVAIFAVIVLLLFISLFTSQTLTSGLVNSWHYLGFFFGGLVLMIGGAMDDKWNLPPRLT